MANGIKKFKPGVSLRTHKIVAAAIWSVVGIFLMLQGGRYLLVSGSLWLLVIGLMAGSCKSLFMLDKSAKRNINRIEGLTEGTCLGGVYSIKMWGVVACMIIFGRLLRASGLPVEFIGVVYVTVGWALLLSSRLFWKKIQ